MAKRNYNKQLERRERIKEKTLVVGMDIGSEFNAMALMDKGGEIKERYSKVYNSRRGFDYFKDIIEGMKERGGYEEVLIGMEPTGHYWRKIAFFGKEQGYEVRFIRTTALKHQRELDESSSAKTDIRDAVTIGNITREGKYIDTVIEEGVLRQLRTLGRLRERIQRYNTGAQHRLRAVLDDYFPEITGIFWSMKAKGLRAILEKSPFPEDIIKMSKEEVGEIIARGSRRKEEARKKAEEVYERAKESIGLKRIGIGDRYRLRMSLDEMRRWEEEIKGIEKQMRELLEEVPYAKYIYSIRGVGILSTAVLLGEIGNPYYFRDYRGIVKYSGYDPIEDESGKRVGRKRISKKGRWLLRKYIYFISMRVIQRNEYFKEYYNKKAESKNIYGQRISKKEAICAVAIKVIKVMYALIRDKRVFSVESPSLVEVGV